MSEHLTNGLNERAMIFSLHLSAWGGQRLDRKTTNEVLEERKAAPDAGRFETQLVPPSTLKPVSAAHTRARARHYGLTLPWGDEGLRIGASAGFFDYTNAMKDEEHNCTDTYNAFYVQYPIIRAEAPLRLGDKLYRANDFPELDEIKTRFGFKLDMLPVPTNDFRLDIGKEAEDKIRKSVEQSLTDRFVGAQKDLFDRLKGAMQHFAVTMRSEDKVFRDTTITKLADLAAIVPKLTLVKDPALDAVCAEILEVVNRARPKDFRENKKLRAESSRDAEAALKKLDDAMAGAF